MSEVDTMGLFEILTSFCLELLTVFLGWLQSVPLHSHCTLLNTFNMKIMTDVKLSPLFTKVLSFTFSIGNCSRLLAAYTVWHSLFFGLIGFVSTMTTRNIIATCLHGRGLRLEETMCFAQSHQAKWPKLRFRSGILEFQKPNTPPSHHSFLMWSDVVHGGL